MLAVGNQDGMITIFQIPNLSEESMEENVSGSENKVGVEQRKVSIPNPK